MAVVEIDPVQKIRRDVRRAWTRDGAQLSSVQARWFVDTYYQVQDFRIQASAQARTAEESSDPLEATAWLTDQFVILEREIQSVLGAWARGRVPGQWAQTITGIGPVLSAGLVAHIDIERAPTVGHIWRFAGLDPTVKWDKGQKRPWNAKLKVLCWKIGDSFVKQKGRDSDYYGKVYQARKDWELEQNAAGAYAEQAATSLAEKKIQDKELRLTYEAGRLPLGRIELRARRYAVKLFLAHYHHVAFEDRFGTTPPRPYVIEHLGHAHFLAPPNWPLKP